MDARQSEYSQSGLSSPYPTYPEPSSEGSSADQASAAQYPQGQDPRASNYSASATPTSEYALNPSSARSGSFPEYIQRSYQHSPQSANAGSMAQASPSLPLTDGQNNDHPQQQLKSDDNVPIDPSIGAPQPSPGYQYGQPSPYPPNMYPGYPAQPSPISGDPHHHYGHGSYYPPSTGQPTAAMVSPVQRPPTVGVYGSVCSRAHNPPRLGSRRAWSMRNLASARIG